MSRKTELIKVFKDYKGKYEALQEKITEINKSTDYTPEGRERVITEMVYNFAQTVDLYHNKGVEIIDKGLEVLVEKWRANSSGKLSDGDYQAGLANVLKMLELGAVQEKEDLQNIIDEYKYDFNALAAIRKVLKNTGDKITREVEFPLDNREKTKQLLNQLKGNVDRYIRIETLKTSSRAWNTFNQGLTDVSSSMDSMAEFVETKLGDNLELL